MQLNCPTTSPSPPLIFADPELRKIIWIQNRGPNQDMSNAIWYDKTSSAYVVGPKKYISRESLGVEGIASPFLITKDEITCVHEAKTWFQCEWNGTEWVYLNSELIGMCLN